MAIRFFSTGRLPLIYNFNNVLPIYHQDIYSQLRNHMKIIHYTYNKPFHITEANQLSDSAIIELWSIWQNMYHNMLNQSSI
jgi:lipopolysaccharide biosynthesis glycosyltransferase